MEWQKLRASPWSSLLFGLLVWGVCELVIILINLHPGASPKQYPWGIIIGIASVVLKFVDSYATQARNLLEQNETLLEKTRDTQVSIALGQDRLKALDSELTEKFGETISHLSYLIMKLAPVDDTERRYPDSVRHALAELAKEQTKRYQNFNNANGMPLISFDRAVIIEQLIKKMNRESHFVYYEPRAFYPRKLGQGNEGVFSKDFIGLLDAHVKPLKGYKAFVFHHDYKAYDANGDIVTGVNEHSQVKRLEFNNKLDHHMVYHLNKFWREYDFDVWMIDATSALPAELSIKAKETTYISIDQAELSFKLQGGSSYKLPAKVNIEQKDTEDVMKEVNEICMAGTAHIAPSEAIMIREELLDAKVITERDNIISRTKDPGSE